MLGNVDPDRVLGDGDYEEHLLKLKLGTKEERDAFVKKYGVKDTIDNLEQFLQAEESMKQTHDTGGAAWYKEMMQYHKQLINSPY